MPHVAVSHLTFFTLSLHHHKLSACTNTNILKLRVNQKMPVDGVYVSPEGKKTFIPLENNPEVFTSLIHDLGVSPELGFYDVYSLEDEDLLSLVPRPVFALIFITPGPMYHAVRKAEKTPPVTHALTYDKTGDDEPVMWFLQTIGHACGLISLLHSVANGEARDFVEQGSTLDSLLAEAAPLKPNARARLLYDSEKLEKAHMKVAKGGDSTAPDATDPCGFHFITFVRGRDNHLWELEGCTDGPIDLGELKRDDDMLSEAALKKGVRRFIEVADGNVEFSIIALAKKPAQ